MDFNAKWKNRVIKSFNEFYSCKNLFTQISSKYKTKTMYTFSMAQQENDYTRFCGCCFFRS